MWSKRASNQRAGRPWNRAGWRQAIPRINERRASSRLLLLWASSIIGTQLPMLWWLDAEKQFR